jgi:hypothetical protein
VETAEVKTGAVAPQEDAEVAAAVILQAVIHQAVAHRAVALQAVIHRIVAHQEEATQAVAAAAALVPIMTPETPERGSRLRAERWY